MTKKKQKIQDGIKEPELKEFLVSFSATGHGSCLVMTRDEQDARDNFFNLEASHEELTEWEFDEVLDVESNE